jgi:hypothetical protein
MDAALAWSRREWKREEAEQQHRLLEEAAAWRRATPAPLIKLEDSSDDKWYRSSPLPPRIGDPGQGSSRWGAPSQSSSQQALPKDNDDSNDGGDYTPCFMFN